MAQGHTVGWICQQLGVHRSTPYKHRAQDVEFGHAWRVAEECGVQCLEQHARDLAVEGVERPVFQGKQVGSYREYDSEMVRFLLRAKRPAIYRERADLLEGIDLDSLTPEQRHQLRDLLTRVRESVSGPRSDDPTLGRAGGGDDLAARRRAAQVLLLGRPVNDAVGGSGKPESPGEGGRRH